ncbi:DUF4376 domain-containing protein [Prevotella disiens]|uniref:hypothetical protein n=1 Tax=Prevotella disiens TaxID=28130 RepID=UPI000690BA81|nr:hypothetical protein [Prevotella disiens]
MIKYINKETGDVYNGQYIKVGEDFIINPSEETLLEHGYEKVEVPEDKLKQAIEAKVSEIKAYDNSEAVNSFSLNGVSAWINREDRIGTRRAIELDVANGLTESEIWLNGLKMVVNCQLALKLLDAVGHYAYQAYNVTQTHLFNVKGLKSVEEVEKYDYTTNYPPKLNLKTT